MTTEDTPTPGASTPGSGTPGSGTPAARPSRLGRVVGRLGRKTGSTADRVPASTPPESPPFAPRGTVVEVFAPVPGTAIGLDQVADRVFASRALGEGAAVRPTDGRIVAPVTGTVVSAMPHAFGLRTDEGVEILIHVGLDTVSLGGQHFRPVVTQGERVTRGDLLVEVDLGAVTELGYDTSTVVLVTNTAAMSDVRPAPGGPATVDTRLLTVVL